MKDIRKISIEDALHYEVHSHWMAKYIFFSLGQSLMSKYFVWKVKRKYKRYSVSLDIRKELSSISPTSKTNLD